MKKLLLVLLFLSSTASMVYAQQSITLTTYYAAPFGIYDRLRLVPGAPPLCTRDGIMYVDSADFNLYICRAGVWEPIDSVWTQSGDDVFLTDTLINPNLQVGIGTISPQYDLHVSGVGGNVLLENDSTDVIFNDTNGADDWDISVWQDLLEFGTGTLPGAFSTIMTMDASGNVGLGITNPQNKLDVEGGAVIGATYSGTYIAPANGLLVQGNLGIGTGTTRNKLDVEGGVTVGSNYSGTNAAPANGLIVEGNVGIGDRTPDNKVDIVGNVVIGAGYAAASRVAPSSGLEVEGDVDIGGQMQAGGEVTVSNANRGRIDFSRGAYIYDNGTQLILGN